MVSIVAKKKPPKPVDLNGTPLQKEQQAVSAPATVAPPSPPKSGPVVAPPSTTVADKGTAPGIQPPPAAPPPAPPAPVGNRTTAPMVIPDANLAGTVGSSLPPAAIDKTAVPKPDSSNDAFDQAVADLLMSEVQGAGKVDTKAEEDLIQQQMGDAIGQQLVGQRASMGRSGFGSSGALAAMEADTQRTARQQALEDVLGLRKSEDQRAKDNADRAIGTDIDKRKQAEDEFFNRQMLEALKSALGIEGDPTATPSGDVQDRVAPVVLDAVNAGLMNGGAATKTAETATAGAPQNTPDTPVAVGTIPAGAYRYGTNKAGQEIYAVKADGKTTFYTKG